MILTGTVKYRGKAVEWEFHRLYPDFPDRWYGRPAGSEEKPKSLTGHKLKAAQDFYVKHLESLAAKVPETTSEVEAAIERFKETGETNLPDKDARLLADLEINNDTVIRPEYLSQSYMDVMGGPLPDKVIIGRVVRNGLRHYMFVSPTNDPMSANRYSKVMSLPGVTSIIAMTTPTPPSLVEWKANYPGGLKAANEYTEYRSALGTMMHHVFALIQNGTCPALDSPDWHTMIDLRLQREGYDPRKHHREWHGFLCKAIMSFLQWMVDYDVEIVLMEIGLVSERLGYAGQIDMVCTMNDKIYTKPAIEVFPAKKPKPDRPKRQTKALAAEHGARHWDVSRPDGGQKAWGAGDREIEMDSRRELNMQDIFDRYVHNPRTRVKAIVDFKSGAHDYDDHYVQLGFYVPLLLDNFPNFDATGLQVYNWHPSDWNEEKMTCSYKLINQSKFLSQRRTDCLLELYNIDCNKSMGNVLDFHGIPQIGVDPREFIQRKPFEEHWEETFHLALDLGLDI